MAQVWSARARERRREREIERLEKTSAVSSVYQVTALIYIIDYYKGLLPALCRGSVHESLIRETEQPGFSSSPSLFLSLSLWKWKTQHLPYIINAWKSKVQTCRLILGEGIQASFCASGWMNLFNLYISF